MNSIVAGTTNYITVSFYDKNGTLAAPSSASWKAIDVETKTEMQSTTVLTPASSIEITVPDTVNVLVDDTNWVETRRIIVTASYGVGESIVATFDYQISNSEK